MTFSLADLVETMSGQATELSHAVRFRTVGKYFGQLCLALALLTAVPLVVSLGFRDISGSLRYAVTVVVLGTAGFGLSRMRASQRILANEAMVIVTLVYIMMPLLMAYPLSGSGLHFFDALFEAVSALTTTGLSALDTMEDKPPALLFTRSWMQWYGGLGIVVLSLALLIHPGLTAKTLAVTDVYEEDLAGGTRAHARRVLIAYSCLTALGITVLWLLGGDLFNAIVYTLSAVSTGGFSPHDESLMEFGSWTVQWATTLLCLAGAVTPALYYTGFRNGIRHVYEDLQLRGLLVAALFATLGLMLCLILQGMDWSRIVYHGPLLAISAQTTTGFSTLDPARLDPAAKGVLILSMAIGGGIGSTAGGFKIFRLLILLRLVHLTVVRTCLPAHAVLHPYLGDHRLQDKEIEAALGIILLFLTVVFLSWLPFLAMGYDPLNSLFEIVSATGTVGLSTGIAGPDLPVVLEVVLCMDMLLGRLEIVAWIVLFYPKTWIGKRAEV